MATESKCLFGQVVSVGACVGRILFFISCVLLFLDQIGRIVMYFMVTDFATELELDISSYSFFSYAQFTLFAVVALMGAHGAYTKNPKYLKIFAVVIAVFSVTSLLVLAFAASQDKAIESHVEKFQKDMRELAKDYQFNVDSKEGLNKETKIWDACQHLLQCCGLEGPEDWTKWRPFAKAPLTLPHSCCSQGPRNAVLFGAGSDKCQIGDYRVRQDGCVKKLGQTIAMAFVAVIHKYISHCILALVAFLLAKYYEPTTGGVVDSNCCTRTDNSNYQKFNGSVYVRQTATGPMAPTAGMYPNAHGVEKGNITPPPVYSGRA